MATRLPLFCLPETGFKLTKHVRKSKGWVHLSFTNACLRHNVVKKKYLSGPEFTWPGLCCLWCISLIILRSV